LKLKSAENKNSDAEVILPSSYKKECIIM